MNEIRLSIGNATVGAGKNVYAEATSKNQAVRILMERGCPRAAARSAVELVVRTRCFTDVRVKDSNEVVEVRSI